MTGFCSLKTRLLLLLSAKQFYFTSVFIAFISFVKLTFKLIQFAL